MAKRAGIGKAKRAQAFRGHSIGLAVAGTPQLIEKLRDGLAYSTLEKFQRASNLSPTEISDFVQIAPRTLVRRKAEGRFKPDESDRLLRASMIFEKAVGLFEGDVPAATQWLKTPQRALAGQTAIEFAKTEIGAREVEDLIGRLEHGVFT